MKQTWKKATGLFLTLVCMLTLFIAPVQAAALDDNTKQSIIQSFQSFLDAMNTSSQEQMEEQMESLDSVFLDTMVEKYYETIEEAGAFKEIVSSDVTVNEDGKSAEVTLMAAFEKYDAKITATCFYNVSNATNYDDLWSAFNIDIDYPISVLLKQAGLNTLMGICIVFFMLVFLSFVISLFKHVNKIGRPKETPVQEAPKAIAAAPAPAVTETRTEELGEDEIAAVIAAAIAAYEAENGSGDGFVVRSIKKVNSKSWKRA